MSVRCPVCGQAFKLPAGSTTGSCPNCGVEWPLTQVTVQSSWLTTNVIALAESILADKAFDRLPILADALEDAGCADQTLLGHCRQTARHWDYHCWVIDLLLNRLEATKRTTASMTSEEWEKQYLEAHHGAIPSQCPRCGNERIVRLFWGRREAWGPYRTTVDRGQAILVSIQQPPGGPTWACLSCAPEWLTVKNVTTQD